MLIHRIYDWAARRADAPALRIDGHALSYRTFAMVIEAARRYLSGLKADGAVFALIGAAGVDGWVLTIAARALGLHTIVLHGPAQVTELGLGARAVILVMSDIAPPLYEKVALETGCALICVPSSAFAEPPSLDRIVLPQDRDCGGHVLLTSGTTGAYKKILIDPGAEGVRAAALTALFKTSERTILFMGPIGLWTSAGHNRQLLTWYAGGCVVLSTTYDLVSPLLANGDVDELQLTVPFLAKLVDQLPTNFRRNDRIRVGLVGSSPSWSLVERTRAKLTSNINVELGSTEAGTIASTRIETPGDLTSHVIVPGREVLIVDEAERAVPPGDVGLVKIRLRDKDVQSYFESPEETARFFRPGYFLPGDLGRIDGAGRLELHGRVTDVISIDGDKISILPLEQRLERLLAVEAVALIATPHQNGRDDVHVVIQSSAPSFAAEPDRIRQVLSKFSNIEIHVVEAIPRNHMGKIDRLALRRRLHIGGSLP